MEFPRPQNTAWLETKQEGARGVPKSGGTAWVHRAAPWGLQLRWDLQPKVREGQAGPGWFWGRLEGTVQRHWAAPSPASFPPIFHLPRPLYSTSWHWEGSSGAHVLEAANLGDKGLLQ